jgi:hypothetical protein
VDGGRSEATFGWGVSAGEKPIPRGVLEDPHPSSPPLADLESELARLGPARGREKAASAAAA